MTALSPRSAKLVNLRLKTITPVQIQDTIFAELKKDTALDISDLTQKFSEVQTIKSPKSTEKKQTPQKQELIDPRRSQQLGTFLLYHFWKHAPNNHFVFELLHVYFLLPF